MTFETRYYPPEWHAMRRQKLTDAGYCCQHCGVAHLSVRQNTKTGENYLVYLSVAHRNRYETWRDDAETMVLCQRCHRRFDRQFRRKGGRSMLVPIGYATLHVDRGSEQMSAAAGAARTYEDLRDMIAALPDGVTFEVQLIINLAVVGNGLYRKEDEQYRVLREHGACAELYTALALEYL